MDRFFRSVVALCAGVVYNISHATQVIFEKALGALNTLTGQISESLGTVAQNFAYVTHVAKNIPYAEVAQDLKQWALKRQVKIGLIIAGSGVLLMPGLITSPMLSLLGFGAEGVVYGSIAAIIHSVLGPVASASLFAILQSAGAGGAGLATLNAIAQLGAAATIAGITAKTVARVISTTNITADQLRIMQHMMIANNTTSTQSGSGNHNRLEDCEKEE